MRKYMRKGKSHTEAFAPPGTTNFFTTQQHRRLIMTVKNKEVETGLLQSKTFSVIHKNTAQQGK